MGGNRIEIKCQKLTPTIKYTITFQQQWNSIIFVYFACPLLGVNIGVSLSYICNILDGRLYCKFETHLIIRA